MGSANCCDNVGGHADSVTISVYGTGGLLSEQTWTYVMGFSSPLVFNDSETTKIVFSTTGGGESVFGYDTAYFEVDKVTYEGGSGNPNPVPEPQTYALLLSGLLMLTFAARRARRPAPARTVS